MVGRTNKKKGSNKSNGASVASKKAERSMRTRRVEEGIMYVSRIITAFAVLALAIIKIQRRFFPSKVVKQNESRPWRQWSVQCSSSDSQCGTSRSCDRVVFDEWADEATVDALLSIAEAGMLEAPASVGGPVIMDANSGYVMKPGAQLSNMYQDKSPFSSYQLELYRRVIQRLKLQVEASLHAPLFFTAPTFIARLSGLNSTWEPVSPHDEYYHPHVDAENTKHYEYSGLLYLSDYGVDFQGGLFEFLQPNLPNSTLEKEPTAASTIPTLQIEPRRGRLLLFASTGENRHRVTRVTAGIRYALSFWFTCDKQFEFNDFLDGKAHIRFREEKGGGGGIDTDTLTTPRGRNKQNEL